MAVRLRALFARCGIASVRAHRALSRGIPLAALALSGAAAAGPVSLFPGAPEHLPLDASAGVREVAGWISHSGDNGGLPYLIIDKVRARVFVFNAQGGLAGADAALLGMARGDHTAPGIGDMRISAIRPEDRTTPAGRFVATLDRDIKGRGVLLIDYDASIALHAVVPGTPAERRAERLRSETPDDNRISFGCINVPGAFYDQVIARTFRDTAGIVYILPETRHPAETFGYPATSE